MAIIKEDPSKNSGIAICAVRIFNFRCLRAVEAHLKPVTILVGENNAGKTSFLEALHGAIGSGQRQFSDDDIWTNVDEKHAPKDRSITVDLMIRPVGDDLNRLESFPSGSPWLELWGRQEDAN